MKETFENKKKPKRFREKNEGRREIINLIYETEQVIHEIQDSLKTIEQFYQHLYASQTPEQQG